MHVLPGTNWWLKCLDPDENLFYYEPVLLFQIHDGDIAIILMGSSGRYYEAKCFEKIFYSSEDLSEVTHMRSRLNREEQLRMDELLQKAKCNKLTEEEKALIQSLLCKKTNNGT